MFGLAVEWDKETVAEPSEKLPFSATAINSSGWRRFI
jgi:hypothetical protein